MTLFANSNGIGSCKRQALSPGFWIGSLGLKVVRTSCMIPGHK